LDTLGDTIDNKAVAVVNVSDPVKGLLVRLDSVSSILDSFVNFFALVLDIFKSWHDG
jgi:hypothetical protein